MCSEATLVENIASIAAKDGYPYRRQVVGMERYAQRVLAEIRQAV